MKRSVRCLMNIPMRVLIWSCLASLIAASGIWAQGPTGPDTTYLGESYYSSSSTAAGGPFFGININAFLGANTFYSNGFTGQNARIANVEAGHVWNGHETLSHIPAANIFNTPGTLTGSWSSDSGVDRHATWVGFIMNGRIQSGGNYYQQGMAPDATLYSVNIAQSWNGTAYRTSFNTTTTITLAAYRQAMVVGINGQTADVLNSSWGSTGSTGGNSYFAASVDALIRQSGKAAFFSAGNSGTANSIGAPGNGINAIVVGSVGSDTANPPFNTTSSFSSRAPQNLAVPNSQTSNFSGTYTTMSNVRARVDLTAPGQNLTGGFYGGTTGGNLGGTNTPGNNFYSTDLQGTSFSSPTAAGGGALLVSALRTLNISNPGSVPTTGLDSRIIKAVLMNSADKTSSWSNGQSLVSGVIVTTQALDNEDGAGRMNLSRAFDNYLGPNATRDAGNGGLANPIKQTGWALGNVTATGTRDYFFEAPLLGGTNFTATLTWWADRSFVNPGVNDNILENAFANLDLQVWTVSNGTANTLVARSSSLWNSSEHLSFALPGGNSEYLIRVVHTDWRWNFAGNTNESFGLAWSATVVPEPATIALVVGMLGGVVYYRRRRRLQRIMAETEMAREDGIDEEASMLL